MDGPKLPYAKNLKFDETLRLSDDNFLEKLRDGTQEERRSKEERLESVIGYPEPYVFARFAFAAYQDRENDESQSDYETKLKLPEGKRNGVYPITAVPRIAVPKTAAATPKNSGEFQNCCLGNKSPRFWEVAAVLGNRRDFLKLRRFFKISVFTRRSSQIQPLESMFKGKLGRKNGKSFMFILGITIPMKVIENLFTTFRHEFVKFISISCVSNMKHSSFILS